MSHTATATAIAAAAMLTVSVTRFVSIQLNRAFPTR
jgi:hypothetical protein